MLTNSWTIIVTLTLLFSVIQASKCSAFSGSGSSLFNDEESNFPQNSNEKLRKIQELLVKYNYKNYLIFGSEHGDEYANDCNNRIKYMVDDFEGPIQILFVNQTYGMFATDDTHIKDQNQKHHDWDVLSYDRFQGRLFFQMADQTIYMTKNTTSKKLFDKYTNDLDGNILELIDKNLVDEIWAQEKMEKCNSAPKKTFEYPIQYAGISWIKKIDLLRNMLEKGSSSFAYVTSNPENIAWLFNLRGQDIPYIPFFYAHAIITFSDIRLYIDGNKVSDELRNKYTQNCDKEKVNQNCIKFLPYDEVSTFDYSPFEKVYYDENINMLTYEYLPDTKEKAPEAVKQLKFNTLNTMQIEAMKQAQIKDSIAFIEAMAEVEKVAANVSEYEVLSTIEKHRRKQSNYWGISMKELAASGINAANPDHKPTSTNRSPINPHEFFVVETGAQYFEGTTVLARTHVFGVPTTSQKTLYTAILKGLIDYSRFLFPFNRADAIHLNAKAPLHEICHNHDGRISHGVGYFTSANEYPTDLSSEHDIVPGMVITIEPKLYLNDTGIKMTNLAMIKQIPSDPIFQIEGQFHGFDTLTLIPFEEKLIDFDKLKFDQVQWLIDYYKTIEKEVKPKLSQLGKKYVDARISKLLKDYQCYEAENIQTIM